jgi:curved DNA-binding protein CbpA
MEMQIDLDPEERDLLPGEPSAPPSGDEAFEEDGHEVSFASGVPSVPRGPDEPPEPSDPLLEAAEAAVRAEVARIEKAENAFSVLGLEPGADVEVLRGAYFKIARQLHPDRVGADREDLREKAAAAFDKARAAWEEVKDEERRLQLVDRLVHGKKTEEEEALEAVQEILATERLIDRGLAQFRSGRLVQAYELFQQAQEKAAGIKEFKSSDLGIYLGYLTWRLQLGRDDEAAERGFNMLQDALNEAQRHQDGWVLLGRILKERGSADEARRCFIRALKINPENKDAFREMDRMKKEKEEAEQAGKGFLARLFSRKKGKEKEKKEE